MKTYMHNSKLSAFLIMLCLVFSANTQAEDTKSRVMIGFKKGNDKSIEASLKASESEIHYHFSNLNVFAASVPQAALKGLKNRHPSYSVKSSGQFSG